MVLLLPAQPWVATRGSDEHTSEQGHGDNLASSALLGSAQRPLVLAPGADRLGVLFYRWKEGCQEVRKTPSHSAPASCKKL